MESLIGKLNDGGPFFSYPILVLILVIAGLFIKGMIERKDNPKIRSLLASLGWFTFAWGYLGRTIGLIKAFDNIAAAGELTPRLLAGGMKMALVDPLLGIIAFLIARLFIIILVWKVKELKNT